MKKLTHQVRAIMQDMRERTVSDVETKLAERAHPLDPKPGRDAVRKALHRLCYQGELSSHREPGMTVYRARR